MSNKLIHSKISKDKHTVIIKDWDELSKIESPTHYIEVDERGCNALVWHKSKEDDFPHYLSTHTFYESQYVQSTELLQSCGFNVILESWG